MGLAPFSSHKKLMTYTAFRALKRDSIKLDLYEVSLLIFDEMQLNHAAINRVSEKLAGEWDQKVFSSLQEEFNRLKFMNEGLRSLWNKVDARLDEYHSLANTAPTESIEVHSISSEEISNSTVLHTTTRILPEAVHAPAGSDGDEEISKSEKKRGKLYAVGGESV